MPTTPNMIGLTLTPEQLRRVDAAVLRERRTAPPTEVVNRQSVIRGLIDRHLPAEGVVQPSEAVSR